jgi:hypothetical protein
MLPKLNFTITENEKLLTLSEYKKIATVVNNLIETGTVQKLQGNCISAAELVASLLDSIGISSRIVECQCAITKNQNQKMELYFIGFDNVGFKGELDTHLVVITETEIPILIDLSIGNFLPSDRPVLIEECQPINTSSALFADIDFENYNLKYSFKKTIKIPSLHQKNIFERIEFEKNIHVSLKFLKIACITAIGLSAFNFFLNWILVILKLNFL